MSFLNVVVNVKLNVIKSIYFDQADIGIFEMSMQIFVSFKNIYVEHSNLP